MKKAIFIVCVLGLLWGCKKEKVEPVEVGSANPNVTNGRYDQPKSAEIFYNALKLQLSFDYNSQGLVTNITANIDSLKGNKSEKYYEAKYDYQNGLVSKISYKTYPPSFLEFAEPESENESEVNYSYDGSVLKHVQYKSNNQTIEQNDFFYDFDGNVDYVLNKAFVLGSILHSDSTNFSYITESNTQKVTREEFRNTRYFVPEGLIPKDTGSNGFVRFDTPMSYVFSEFEFTKSIYENFKYSKLQKRLQLEVEKIIFGNYGLSEVESIAISKFIKSYYAESRLEAYLDTKNRGFEYIYKTNDKGQLISFASNKIGNPSIESSLDTRSVKITY